VSRFAADYREAAADLARLTTALDGRDDDAAFRLGRLVAEGHNLLYRRARVRPRGALAYVGRTVPGAVLRAWRPVALSALLLFGPMLVSAVAVARAPARAAAVLPESMLRRAAGSAERARRGAGYIEDPELFRPVMAGSIIANNVQVAFVAFAAGVTAGVGTALALVVNGVSIGGVFGLYASYGTFPLILAFVAPHGVLELTAIAVAGGAGLLLAAAVLLPARAPAPTRSPPTRARPCTSWRRRRCCCSSPARSKGWCRPSPRGRSPPSSRCRARPPCCSASGC
jgi:uncharacterized membrane protein SpoIIM required for sporulation